MKGFTLLELLIVLVILGFGVFTLPRVSGMYRSLKFDSSVRKVESLFRFARFFSMSSGKRLLVEVFPKCSEIVLKTEPERLVKLPKDSFCKVNGQILERELTLFVSPHGILTPVVISFFSNSSNKAYKLWFPPPSFLPKLEKAHKTLEIN